MESILGTKKSHSFGKDIILDSASTYTGFAKMVSFYICLILCSNLIQEETGSLKP
jgi:hypothetical protein